MPLSPADFYKSLSKNDKQAVVNLSVHTKIDFIPTGSWVINKLIGDGTMTKKPGGLPRGHIVEVFGDESSGKSTLALSACHQAQLLGGIAVYVDFEKVFHDTYAKALGLDLSQDKFILLQPDHFEHGANLIDMALEMKPMIVVCDSVSAMIPQGMLEGKIDDIGPMGQQARLVALFLNRITKRLKEANTCLLLINQLRAVIKKSKWDTGPDEDSSGGYSLKYFTSIRIKLQTSSVERVAATNAITGKADKDPVNIMIKTTVVKNKIDKPFYTGPVYIRFGEGFDNLFSIMELAINNGTIKQSGSFLRLDIGDETVFNVQGKEQLRTLLDEHQDIYKKLLSSLTFQEDKEAEVIYKEENDKAEKVGALLVNEIDPTVEKTVVEKPAAVTPEKKSEQKTTKKTKK